MTPKKDIVRKPAHETLSGSAYPQNREGLTARENAIENSWELREYNLQNNTRSKYDGKSKKKRKPNLKMSP